MESAWSLLDFFLSIIQRLINPPCLFQPSETQLTVIAGTALAVLCIIVVNEGLKPPPGILSGLIVALLIGCIALSHNHLDSAKLATTTKWIRGYMMLYTVMLRLVDGLLCGVCFVRSIRWLMHQGRPQVALVVPLGFWDVYTLIATLMVFVQVIEIARPANGRVSLQGFIGAVAAGTVCVCGTLFIPEFAEPRVEAVYWAMFPLGLGIGCWIGVAVLAREAAPARRTRTNGSGEQLSKTLNRTKEVRTCHTPPIRSKS